jgi:hypothetical protein
MKYSKFSGISVDIDGITWDSVGANLPASESYSIGFKTLEDNYAFTEDEDDPLAYNYCEKALRILLEDMLAEDYLAKPIHFTFIFTMRP